MRARPPSPAAPGDTSSLAARVAWLLAADALVAPRGLADALVATGDLALIREQYTAWISSLRVPESSADLLLRHLEGRPHRGLALAQAHGLRVDDLLGVHESLGTVVLQTVARVEHDVSRAWQIAQAVFGSASADELTHAQATLLRLATGAPTLFDVWPESGRDRMMTVWRREVAVPPPEAEPLASPSWFVHGAVDRLGLLLARAALGPLAPPARQWLPCLRASVSGDVPQDLRRNCSPELLPSCASDVEVAAYLGLLGRDELKTTACRRVFGGALERWKDVASRVFQLVGDNARPWPLRALARAWLARARPCAPPPGRFRLASGPASAASAGEPGAFQLDPVGSLGDCELIRTTWLGTHRTLEMGTWLVNEWPEARDLVRALAIGAGADGEARRGVVWVHHALFHPAGSKELSAFKKSVSVAGRAAWCLTELDEAVVSTCPPNTPLPDWWQRCATRVRGLPKEAWTASQVWLDGVRSIRFLSEIFMDDCR